MTSRVSVRKCRDSLLRYTCKYTSPEFKGSDIYLSDPLPFLKSRRPHASRGPDSSTAEFQNCEPGDGSSILPRGSSTKRNAVHVHSLLIDHRMRTRKIVRGDTRGCRLCCVLYIYIRFTILMLKASVRKHWGFVISKNGISLRRCNLGRCRRTQGSRSASGTS